MSNRYMHMLFDWTTCQYLGFSQLNPRTLEMKIQNVRKLQTIGVDFRIQHLDKFLRKCGGLPI